MIAMTETEIFNLLDTSLIGRLAMADPTGRPYAIPLPFCRIDGTIYLRVPMTGRKGDILALNNQVCFEVDVFTDQLDDYASILVEGRLVGVDDLAEKARVRMINDAKYNVLRHAFRPGHRRRTALEDLPTRKIINATISGRKISPPDVSDSAPMLVQYAKATDE
jgi:nitroimidazol reductase NimA-like FMN-containing flavoprotein (pyridoxamine 5'-phosphate oxidase superfamily)